MRMILASFLLAAACTPFPDLSASITDSARAAPYPLLTPVPAVPPQITDAETTEFAARLAALRARAAAIRQKGIAALQ